MEAPICISPATLADAGIISRIIERSIRIGCALDHRNAPSLVTDWIRQQSADHISGWLVDPHFYLNIALLQDKPVGVGMVMASGEIAICYVQPECFYRGVGRALMSDLEGWLRIRGVLEVQLNSTRTGEAFYRHLGYRESAPPLAHKGLKILPMCKRLPLPADKSIKGVKSSGRLSVSRTGKPASAPHDRNAHVSGVLFWSLSIAN